MAYKQPMVLEPLTIQTEYSFSDVFSHKTGAGPVAGRIADRRDILKGRTVMIVEDEALIGFALEMELEELGAMSVGPITTLSSSIEILDTTVIDGAILDIDLNGVDVFPLADHLIEQGISFVFHTAQGDRRKLRDVYPNVPVCLKPANTDDVLNALATVFHNRSRN